MNTSSINNNFALDVYVTQAMAVALLSEREAKLDILIGEIETLQYIIDNPHYISQGLLNDLLEMNTMIGGSND
jgi:hypothetical protein